MKATKKIVGAACALVAAVALSAGSTFAWFAAQKSVDATGMNITATSDNVWLIIQAGSEAFNANSTSNSANTSATNKSLKPVAPVSTITSDNVTTPESWHYAYSNSLDSADKNGSYVTCTTLSGYIESEVFQIGLSNKSGVDEVANLKLTSVDVPDNTGISVVVVCGDNAYTHTSDAASTTQKLADKVTKTGTTVTVYYFINGENTSVYTNNMDTLKGSVKLTFGVD